MANTAAKLVSTYFTSQGINHKLAGDNEEAILTGFNMDNLSSIEILIVFDEDGNACRIWTHDFCRVPEDKRTDLLKTINKLNQHYRWVKFYINNEDGDIYVDMDAVIDMETCGEECEELVLRLCRIVDEAYPEIMKNMWS